MIYTMTLNPSIDYRMNPTTFKKNFTNRSSHESVRVGGKGINVSILLNNLNTKSHCLGFIGGFTGQFIQNELLKYPLITDDFIQTNSLSRINIKLHHEGETEFNGSGQVLDVKVFDELMTKLERLSMHDIVVITGSLPKGAPSDTYVKICAYLQKKGIPFVVDIANDVLLDILPYGPILVKPNQDELKKIMHLDHTENTIKDIIEHAKKMHEMGAKNVIVSMGSSGSLFLNDKECYRAFIPDGDLVDSVGAGDSMVAAFVYAYSHDMSAFESYQLACAAGSATAFSNTMASSEDIFILRDRVIIERIK